MILFSVGVLGALFQLGLEEALADVDESEQLHERAVRWRAAVFAYVAGVVASGAFFVFVWLIDVLTGASA